MMIHSDLPWHWDSISRNPTVTIDELLQYQDIRWNWSDVSKFANISVDNVLQHLDMPWQWDLLSSNTNLSIDDIAHHLDKPWCIEKLMLNPFTKYFKTLSNACMHMAAFRIQLWWRRIMHNPDHRVCNRIQLQKINAL